MINQTKLISFLLKSQTISYATHICTLLDITFCAIFMTLSTLMTIEY